MSATYELNERPDYDQVIQDIADYVLDYRVESEEALNTARHCLMDSLGCALLALRFPECTKHLGPMVEGTVVPNGARVPGTRLCLSTGHSMTARRRTGTSVTGCPRTSCSRATP